MPKNRFLIALFYFAFWYFYFVLVRIVFLLTYIDDAARLSSGELIRTFWYGFKLDASAAAYAGFLPTLVLMITCAWEAKWLRNFYNVYTAIVIVFFNSIALGDLALYGHWGIRLDATPFFYLKNISTASASLNTASIVGYIILLLLVSGVIYLLYHLIFRNRFQDLKHIKSLWFTVPAFVLLGITIRGGLGVSPLNVSYAYFSNNLFASHAAINPVWNVGSGLFDYQQLNKNYAYFSDASESAYLKELTTRKEDHTRLLKTTQPNILLVIVESFTSKVLQRYGADPQIMPEFNRLIHEGIFFDQIYAASDRTDKGIAAVISGYPSLPATSPLKYPNILSKMPSLASTLDSAGYHSTFIYGGTLEFANYKSYLVQAGYDTLVSDIDFPRQDLETKWGAYDEKVLDKTLEVIQVNKAPFFVTTLTLSSHDPFTIPIAPLYKGNDRDTLFLNAIHYTDQCIGNFIARAKQQPWWENTLVIFIADHGSPSPGNSSPEEPQKYHIPMLWLGGAIACKDTVIAALGAQTDLAATLLQQLHIPAFPFTFSNNIFAQANPYTLSTHGEGFVFINGTDTLRYNTINNTFKQNVPGKENLSKAYLQQLYTDLKKKNTY
ncbi:MAG: alkaline phosphatase family protein [Sphingobacteriales bacterium]|nr:MAG: alkaline phosphatase family protein [Sphingobacteriales bacterium]